VKKNIKLLGLPAIIVLTCLTFQTAHGMENSSKPGELFEGILSYFSELISYFPSNIANEKIRENPFERCPKEIRFNVLERTAIDNYGNAGHLACVCKDWWHIIESDKMKKSMHSFEPIKQIYQRFLKGVLIYRPDGKSNVGRIDLPIASLVNPLEGAFDISHCGRADKYLSISTGYRKEKKAENKDKVEIWIMPRFLVETEVQSTASHFNEIFPANWAKNYPIGITWNWGGWDNIKWCHYLTNESIEKLANVNLYQKMPIFSKGGKNQVSLSDAIREEAWVWEGIDGIHMLHPEREWRKFSCSFDNLRSGGKEFIYEQIYQRFLKGILVYRPNGKSDVGRIDLPIASLVNPLEGTFDLSQCGYADKYLSISTGYRKEKKAENKDKVEIWITPRFLIEKEIQSTANHFKGIFPAKWTNNYPIGIIWTWGDWDWLDDYDFLTNLSMDSISDNNLYETWQLSREERCTMSIFQRSHVFYTYSGSTRPSERDKPVCGAGSRFIFTF
jgi:hypothetical protein